MWDHTWDMLTNEKYLNIPYEKWNEVDIFDIRFEICLHIRFDNNQAL